MMEESWLLPITILPAVGLIIMSTTNLSNALGGEINSLLHINKTSLKPIIFRKLKQLRLLSISLLLQYTSGACFAVVGLLEGLIRAGRLMIPSLTLILLCIGITGIVVALIILSIFAFRAFSIKQAQFERQLDN